MTICYSIAYNGLICFYYGSDTTRVFKYQGYSLRKAISRFRSDASLAWKHIEFVKIPV